MDKHLCLHGHFYQPPREDPWMDHIFPEGSAAPFLHWNDRIRRESYAPLAWARRLDGDGRIIELVNCYAYLSFNFGPTLLRWLARADARTYGRILAGDRESVARLGHGNALAQVYHHPILPLATERDKDLEIAWGIADFRQRFGRFPEGMWLAETAADTPTLEALARAGIRFTLLAPRQAAAVAAIGSGSWREVNEGSLDATRPYLVRLPSGRDIAVFFYNGPVSQAVAFEGLLADGDRFWHRLTGGHPGGLRAIATDGETYGHHFTFGEMALAYVISLGRDCADGWCLTNFAAYLADNPPAMEVRLHEPSSWSCVHGVERWRADCGCTTGDHPGWNQAWRGPLRRALNLVRERVDAHFAAAGEGLFKDPGAALTAYGRVYAGAQAPAAFEAEHLRPGLDEAARNSAWKLLSMVQWSLASFASCAWFFDDLARIEPLNAMTFALRAMQLAELTGAASFEAEVVDILAEALSNRPSRGSGRDLWEKTVRVRRETPERLAAQGLIRLWAREELPAPGKIATASWPGVKLEFGVEPGAPAEAFSGRMHVQWPLHAAVERFRWRVTRTVDADPLAARFEVHPEGRPEELGACVPAADLPWKKRQNLAADWVSRTEERVWREAADAAATGGYLFLPLQEYQTTQTLTHKWSAVAPELAWCYVTGTYHALPGEKDLVAFLAAQARSHPGMPMLAERLRMELARLVADRDDTAVLGLLARVRAIGLSVDAWPAQNALWELKNEPETWKKMAEALGFAPASA